MVTSIAIPLAADRLGARTAVHGLAVRPRAARRAVHRGEAAATIEAQGQRPVPFSPGAGRRHSRAIPSRGQASANRPRAPLAHEHTRWMAVRFTIASPAPVIVHVISSGPGWLTLLVTFVLGATLTILVQLYVVPKVETRKRREDRWERNVLELGDLLTMRLATLAYEAKLEQGKFRDVRQLESEPGLDPRAIAQHRAEQASSAEEATWAFDQLLRTRVDWLAARIRDLSSADEIVKLSMAARHYRARTIMVQVRPEHDVRTDEAFEEGWANEYDARRALIERVELLAGLPHPPHAS